MVDEGTGLLRHYEERLALSHEAGESDWARGLTWDNVGEAYVVLDEPARAIEITLHGYRVFKHTHDSFGTATCAFTLGRAAWRLGQTLRRRDAIWSRR